jgi:imidazolonepropionase-like amidohydrolase
MAGVNVVDVENGTILKDRTVKIRDGKIEEISKSSDKDLQESGWSTVDAKGLYMCPGLIDCGCPRLARNECR